jgi:DNA-binding transcriptional regulator PaaX
MTAKITKSKPRLAKHELILNRVGNRNGASLIALAKVTGWQPHSVRAALTALRKKGHAIEQAKNARGVTVYCFDLDTIR